MAGDRNPAELFVCPRQISAAELPDPATPEWINSNTSYVYLANAKTNWQRLPGPTSILLHEKLDAGHEQGIVTLWADGHAEIHRWLDPRTTPPFKKGQKREFTTMKDNRDLIWLQDHATVPIKEP